MLQCDPPPKVVKVTMSKRIPLVGEELAAYEEEQNRVKEEALKASMVKDEESKASLGVDTLTNDPMVIDSSNVKHTSSNGNVQKDAILLKKWLS